MAKMAQDAKSAATEVPLLTRSEYFAERRLLLGARQRSYKAAEQFVVAGATGALVLSITFLEKLVPSTQVRGKGWLITAWVALLVCLCCSFFGQYASARSFDCEIVRLEARLHKEDPPANAWAACNDAFGFIGNVLFVSGIAMLAAFAYLNAPFNQ